MVLGILPATVEKTHRQPMEKVHSRCFLFRETLAVAHEIKPLQIVIREHKRIECPAVGSSLNWPLLEEDNSTALRLRWSQLPDLKQRPTALSEFWKLWPYAIPYSHVTVGYSLMVFPTSPTQGPT